MLKSVRSFDRGLAVIEQLEGRGAASLSDLARASALPKATVLRLLKTLVDRRWAYRRVNDGRYTLAVSTGRRDPAAARRARIARAGAPLLQRLTAITGFPADLSVVVRPGVLEVVESTRQRMEGGVDPLVAGFQPSLVFSSPGRALLADSDEPARQRHLEHIVRTDSPAERFFVTSGALSAELRRSNQRGYAVRESGYWPDSSDYGEEPMDIAVAIGGTGNPSGSVSIVWPASRYRADEVAERHLADLRAAAEALSGSIS